RSRKRLAIIESLNNATFVTILNAERSKFETELKLPDGGHTKVIAFQSEFLEILLFH
ncbi:unnamed protein product, partial [Hymenolepis diminuta]